MLTPLIDICYLILLCIITYWLHRQEYIIKELKKRVEELEEEQELRRGYNTK